MTQRFQTLWLPLWEGSSTGQHVPFSCPDLSRREERTHDSGRGTWGKGYRALGFLARSGRSPCWFQTGLGSSWTRTRAWDLMGKAKPLCTTGVLPSLSSLQGTLLSSEQH